MWQFAVDFEANLICKEFSPNNFSFLSFAYLNSQLVLLFEKKPEVKRLQCCMKWVAKEMSHMIEWLDDLKISYLSSDVTQLRLMII